MTQQKTKESNLIENSNRYKLPCRFKSNHRSTSTRVSFLCWIQRRSDDCRITLSSRRVSNCRHFVTFLQIRNSSFFRNDGVLKLQLEKQRLQAPLQSPGIPPPKAYELGLGDNNGIYHQPALLRKKQVQFSSGLHLLATCHPDGRFEQTHGLQHQNFSLSPYCHVASFVSTAFSQLFWQYEV